MSERLPCLRCGRRHPVQDEIVVGTRAGDVRTRRHLSVIPATYIRRYWHDAQGKLCVTLDSTAMTAPTVSRV